MRVGLIWAMAENGVIGRDGRLPWHLPDDLKHFKAVTLGCPVLMGRRTYASLGKPLPDRANIVLTSHDLAAPGIHVARSLDAALAAARATGADWAWVIGGAALYAATLPLAARLEVTLVHAAVPGDVIFPAVDWSQFRCVERAAHAADARHPHAFTRERWERASAPSGAPA